MDHKENHPKTVQSLLEDTYVNDIEGGGNSEEEVVTFKEESTMILSEGSFSLHKWHSNVCEASKFKYTGHRRVGDVWQKLSGKLSDRKDSLHPMR